MLQNEVEKLFLKMKTNDWFVFRHARKKNFEAKKIVTEINLFLAPNNHC